MKHSKLIYDTSNIVTSLATTLRRQQQHLQEKDEQLFHAWNHSLENILITNIEFEFQENARNVFVVEKFVLSVLKIESTVNLWS